MPEQKTGSKGLLGELVDIALLGAVLDRLKVWHIDQQYKTLQNEMFSLVKPEHILCGVVSHNSCGSMLQLTIVRYY